MQKPISLVINEFRAGLINIIKESGLPMCVVRPIILELSNELTSLEQKEYEVEYSKYNSKKGKKENV